jgi:AcrR family transcriptional regulator
LQRREGDVRTDYTGGGDPARSLALLWGTRKGPTRGPKPGLSVERIVQVAIATADAEGLAAVSMRRVADQLGVGTMTLYTYVPGKAELLDVMLDTVLGEVGRLEGDGWRARLERYAREEWALYHRHPWILQVSRARALLGPNETDLYEAAMSAVSGTGLSGSEMILVVSLVTGYTRGAAQNAVEAAHTEQRTGVSDAQWWADREPVLDQYFDADRYPTLTSVALTGAFLPSGDGADYYLEHALAGFEFGLARVLDGIDAFIHERGGAGGGAGGGGDGGGGDGGGAGDARG